MNEGSVTTEGVVVKFTFGCKVITRFLMFLYTGVSFAVRRHIHFKKKKASCIT